MTPISKLDGVLRKLASEYPVNKEFGLNDFYTEDDDIGLEAAELFFIMEKLEEDGYVKIRIKELYPKPQKESEYDLISSIPYYTITFKGAYFILNDGGYKGAALRASAENTRVEKLETSQQKLMGKLNVLTGWVAGGAVGLVLWEIVKFFFLEHKASP